MNICLFSKPAYISNYLNKKEGLLVGGFNPIEKMGSSSPIFRGENKKLFELPPTGLLLLMEEILRSPRPGMYKTLSNMVDFNYQPRLISSKLWNFSHFQLPVSTDPTSPRPKDPHVAPTAKRRPCRFGEEMWYAVTYDKMQRDSKYMTYMICISTYIYIYILCFQNCVLKRLSNLFNLYVL